jgi:hypothetical protein
MGNVHVALSVRQPWAWAIIHAGKNVENRSWRTSFRGKVFVHASKSMALRDYDDFCMAAMTRDMKIPLFQDFHRGGIIGEVEIVDCVSSHGSPWFTGPFGFVLSNPTALSFIPCNGALRFFELPGP